MATESQAAYAKLAADTKRACATSADITKAAGKPAAKGIAFHAKSAVLMHSFVLTAIGGIVVGIVAYHLANKYLFNKDEAVEQNTSE